MTENLSGIVKSIPHGRVCSRAGCGMLLVDADGNPDFNRYFCSAKCKRADVRDREWERRRRFANRNALTAVADRPGIRNFCGMG
jgi:ribosomal protein L24E